MQRPMNATYGVGETLCDGYPLGEPACIAMGRSCHWQDLGSPGLGGRVGVPELERRPALRLSSTRIAISAMVIAPSRIASRFRYLSTLDRVVPAVRDDLAHR